MSGWAGGSTRRWREIRRRVLARDGNTCMVRVPGTCVGTSEPMHVHHVHGKASGCPGCRVDAYEHLQAACGPCNLKIGDPMRRPDPPAVPISRW